MESMKSVEENKAIVRRYLEELARGNIDAVDEYMGEGCKQFALDMLGWLRTLLTDVSLTIADQIGEGDKVATRVTFRGKYRGEYKGVAPAGKEVAWQGIAIDRVVNGKVVEMWHEADIWGMMQQIGVV